MTPEIGQIEIGTNIGYKSHHRHIYVSCNVCGKRRWVDYGRFKKGTHGNCRTCAPSQRAYPVGQNHHCWKGGKSPYRGYMRVRLFPNDRFYQMADSKGYILEHRLVMAKNLDRCLNRKEFVHHKNGIRNDNRLENLELMTNGEHLSGHTTGYRGGYRQGYEDGISNKVQKLESEIRFLRLELRALCDWRDRIEDIA